MESLEADRFSACQEIPRMFWNPNGPYHTHNGPPLVPILIQIIPLQSSSFHFFQAHFNIILPSTPMSSKLSLSIRSPDQYTGKVIHIIICALILSSFGVSKFMLFTCTQN